MAALNATEASNGTTPAGTSADNTMGVALMSLADEDAASSQLKNSTKVADTGDEEAVPRNAQTFVDAVKKAS